MAENQIKIEISAGTDELIKALQSADKAAVKFSGSVVSSIAPIEKAATSASNSIKDGFKDAFGSIAKGVAVGNLVSKGIESAFSAVTGFISGSVAAAQEQENALNRLGQALKASGSFSREAVADFKAFASQLQQTSIFGDEVVIGQLAIAKSFGATNDQAKQLVQAAANLAATFGGSLEERVQQLGKTLQGTGGKLGQLIPGFKGLTEEQLKAGAAFDLINSKFGGAAANELNTYTGQVTSLSNALSDFQEELGTIVTQSGFVQSTVSALTGLFQELTQRFSDSRIESERQNEGFVETTESLDQLTRKYEDLKVQLIDYEKVVLRNKDAGFLDSIFTTDNVPLAMERIKLLTPELKKLEDQIAKAKSDIEKTKAEAPKEEVKAEDTRSAKEKAEAQKILAEREALNQQLIQQQADFDAFQAQLNLQKTTLTDAERQVEYDKLLLAEQTKLEAVRQAELAKANLITDAAQRRAAIEAINQKTELERQKAFLGLKNKQEQEALQRKRQIDQGYLDAASNFVQAGLVIAKEGSVAQKALQITQATISTYTGANNALAQVPYPANIAAAASIVALGLANVSRIAGAKFEQGGIVGGSSWHGDNVPVRVNSGEMILNKQQQSELFRVANGEGSGANVVSAMRELIAEVKNMPIIVQANGREIARLIRDEQRNGFEVFA